MSIRVTPAVETQISSRPTVVLNRLTGGMYELLISRSDGLVEQTGRPGKLKQRISDIEAQYQNIVDAEIPDEP